MRIDILTAVPSLVEPVLHASIVGRAIKNNVISIHVHNLHDYASDTFRHIDDAPYGGGAGMVIQCEPIMKCVDALQADRVYDEIIYMTPDGVPFEQSHANELSLKQNVMIIAGHYKGIDQRVRDLCVTREISVGDYVLSGGELPALVVSDAIVRLLPGAISDVESALDDSFQDGYLSPPVYTRPAVFRGQEVPEVLRSGNHEAVRQWRRDQSYERTRQRRPDLLRRDDSK